MAAAQQAVLTGERAELIACDQQMFMQRPFCPGAAPKLLHLGTAQAWSGAVLLLWP